MAKQLIQTIINESIEIHKTDNLILKHNQKKSALKKKTKNLKSSYVGTIYVTNCH